jgi:hypothetical protein
VTALHRVIGFAVVAVFAFGWIWGLGARLARRDPGDVFWTWLAVAQVLAGIQALIGSILLLLGHRLEADDVLGGTLHYVYGYLPLLLFVFAHVVARAGDARAVGIDSPVRPWVPFAWASFISFGLTLRALMTGLGL